MSPGTRAGDKRGLLEEARAWLAHAAFRERVRAALQRHARGAPGVRLSWLPATGRARSAVQLARPGRPPVLLLLTDKVLWPPQGCACSHPLQPAGDGLCGQSCMPLCVWT